MGEDIKSANNKKNSDKENTHSQHRLRLKAKFLKNNLDEFENHEALELLLFYAIPRKDTNPLAHKLLDEFGSISAVIDAPIDSLKKAGLSEHSAILLKFTPQFYRVYLDDKHNNEDKIIDIDNVGDKFIKKFIGRDYEAVVLMLLDAKMKEIFCGVINKGSVNACELYLRKIIENTVLYNASYVIIAHNHPSGIALPSQQDLISTKKIASALNIIGVKLLDHIIVADDDYVSISQSQILESVFGK